MNRLRIPFIAMKTGFRTDLFTLTGKILFRQAIKWMLALAALGLSGSPLRAQIYIANYGTNSILEMAPDGSLTTFATGLSGPKGLAFDSNGDLFVSNYSNGIRGLWPRNLKLSLNPAQRY